MLPVTWNKMYVDTVTNITKKSISIAKYIFSIQVIMLCHTVIGNIMIKSIESAIFLVVSSSPSHFHWNGHLHKIDII